jgi:hypothetical protein
MKQVNVHTRIYYYYAAAIITTGILQDPTQISFLDRGTLSY